MTSDNSKEDVSGDKTPSMEEQFLDGYREDEPDEFDDELLELTQTRDRGSVLRPILMLLVIVAVSSVIYDWRDEIGYFFSPSEAVEVGDTTRFSARGAEDPDWEPPVEHNRYVSIEGMPTRMSKGGGYEFFRLIGAEIYVQREMTPEQVEAADNPSTVPERKMGPGIIADEHRSRYEGQGRMISFAAAPERVAGIKEHFEEHYNVKFCEDFSAPQLEDMTQQRLESMRSRWLDRYENASEEQREIDGLTPEPTDAEEARHLTNNPPCVDAYLVHDGKRPVDQWWYVLFSVLLGLFVLFTVYQLVRWFKAWIRP